MTPRIIQKSMSIVPAKPRGQERNFNRLTLSPRPLLLSTAAMCYVALHTNNWEMRNYRKIDSDTVIGFCLQSFVLHQFQEIRSFCHTWSSLGAQECMVPRSTQSLHLQQSSWIEIGFCLQQSADTAQYSVGALIIGLTAPNQPPKQWSKLVWAPALNSKGNNLPPNPNF